jgi:hypothetical protein
MKLQTQTLALALLAIKEKEAELRQQWFDEQDMHKGDIILVRKNAYQAARIDLEYELKATSIEVTV